MLVPDFPPTRWATAERSFQLGILLSSFTWAPSFTITFLFGGCKDIQVASNRTSTNTSAPNKRNRSESRTTCGGQKKMLLDRLISRRFLHYVRTADLWNMYLTPCYHSNPMGLIKSVSCMGFNWINIWELRKMFLFFCCCCRCCFACRCWCCFFTFLIFLMFVKIWWTRQVLENMAPNPTVNPRESKQNRAYEKED